MSAFHKIIANVRAALDQGAPPRHDPEAPAVAPPIIPGTRRAELVAQFARELEAVNGVYLGAFAPDAARATIVAWARELGLQTAALGGGVMIDAEAIGRALEQAGVRLLRPRDAGRRPFAKRAADCDAGILEADYAIAATGTLAFIMTPARPSAITLLPPINLLLFHVDRVMADLAATFAACGREAIPAHRMALVTGPSRTADIEKMIVLGVHGPRKLYALAVWPRE